MVRAQKSAVEAVREFNRFCTRRIGLLREGLSDRDGRVQHLALIRKGRTAFAMLDRRSASEVETQLGSLAPAAQAKLVDSMNTIHALLEAPAEASPVRLRAHQPGDVGWVIGRHGAVTEGHGWDVTFEGLVAEIAAKFIRNFDAARERCWIAEAGGERVGSVFLVQDSPTVARLRLLLVEPTARGRGVGGRLVNECITFARAAGYQKIALWTEDVLQAAGRLYRRAGFCLLHEECPRSFGRELVGQT